MEVVPYFERRLFSPSSQYPMQNTAHMNDNTSKKEVDAGALQLPSWQVDHSRYYCNQSTPNHCSHRYSTSPPNLNTSEMQNHSSAAWHPFGYDASDSYLTSRTNDVVAAYHGIDPRLSTTRSVYPITSNTQVNSASHVHPGLSNTFHRPVKGMENIYQTQYPSFHRMNGAYSESFGDNKKEWEMAFMRGMPYCKFHVILLLVFCLFMVHRVRASGSKKASCFYRCKNVHGNICDISNAIQKIQQMNLDNKLISF